MKKYIFFAIWIVLLLLVPVTILRTTPLAVALKYPVNITNFIQKFIGMVAFILLFVELILGAFMDKLTKKLGEWIFKFHLFEGVLVYAVVLAHPLFLILFNHFAGTGWDPYRVFINACLLCTSPLAYYYTLGIVSFWLLTLAVFAGIFRKSAPWLKANWRNIHVINYVVFLVVGLHGFLIGTDFRIQPFYSFVIAAYTIVVCIVIFIEIPKLYKSFKIWIRN
ncbi:MAG TPA: hypothetical protein VMR19_03600 [Candidatus Saccharimonadales bacterium]|jgi:hypothetical protein|nr:hypothetical protein [Candidatus Saccharimonadales bacterium]